MVAHATPFILHFTVGALVVTTFLLKHMLQKIHIQALVGFLVLGMGLSLADGQYHMITERGHEIFEFLANVGLIVLLFRTGLESDTTALRRELGPAGLIWVGNFFLSGVLGFLAAYYVLHLSMVTSLVIATGFTATSIAVSIGIWREAGVMNRREAHLLLNVAQMDDISGVAALALLLAMVPMLSGTQDLASNEVLSTLGGFSLNLAIFSAGCIIFAKYIKAPVTRFFERIGETDSCLMLLTAGTGVMIAAIAEGLGLSLAVGALFAGLVFSNNPDAHHIDKMLIPIYNLFAPFFFIGMGLSIDPALAAAGVTIGATLLVPAVAGKVLGGALPALKYLSFNNALALGISLVPRAEIMLVIAGSAKAMGPDVLPDEVFAGLVFISAVTCILTPPLVGPLLRKMSDKDNAEAVKEDKQAA